MRFIANTQWSVETLAIIDDEIDQLPVGLRARLLRLLVTVEPVGLDQMRVPHVRHQEGKLWELRSSAQEGIARGLYVTAARRRAVVLHVFEKQTKKTPRRAIKLALERMKELVG